jgi:hypothetical protein
MAVRLARELLALLSHPGLTGEELVFGDEPGDARSVTFWREWASARDPDLVLWPYGVELSVEFQGARAPLRMSDPLP